MVLCTVIYRRERLCSWVEWDTEDRASYYKGRSDI